ncbi:hypothetical protein [Chondrinema litorale]|uniref:hypothetical protein n=1 Tax=Chondrinema litorale TaxID=2994555 RepID=UPI0025434B72|nr:hypothetical protein [Chondrinema litorale]UZR99827.1 hypothetical protein OQ292_38645 [Chondrinema litorale]
MKTRREITKVPALKDVLSLPRYKRDFDLLRNMLLVFSAACMLTVAIIYMQYKNEVNEAYSRCINTPYQRKFQYMNHVEKVYRLCFAAKSSNYEYQLIQAESLLSEGALNYVKSQHQKEKMIDILGSYTSARTGVQIDSIAIDMSTDPAFGVVYGSQSLYINAEEVNKRNLFLVFKIMDLSINNSINTDGAILMEMKIVDISPIF